VNQHKQDAFSGSRVLIRVFTADYMMDHITGSLSAIFMPVCSALGVIEDVLISGKAPIAGIFANGFL